MYTVSSRLKTFTIALMIIGALGVGYGFFTTPKTVEDVKEIMHNADDSHGAPTTTHGEENAKDVHAVKSAEDHADAEAGHDNEDSHYEHVLTQAKNRPWTAIYVPMIFFLLISVCALVYYAIQRAASAGWSPVLFRVMEGVTGYIGIGSLIVLAFLIASAMHANHIFAWMFVSSDPTAANYDFAMETKEWWLNVPWFLIRAVIYILIWVGFRHFILKSSRMLNETGDLKYFKKSFTLSVVFLVVFLVSELFMAFDWLMSIDHHWFSQLYSFYVFASMFVSAITVIALVTIYLRSRGFLPQVNDSHVHDLAKYMFAFSIFWTYLWYAQFMLQWYANIPEEATYFYPRLIGEYQPLFIGMLIMNFVFPILVLMNSDYKRIPWFVVLAGLIILTGHYLDVFVMVNPGTVGSHWHFGIPEIGALMFFAGLFIFVVFNSLTKAPLHPKENPFIKESEIFHY
ncbi:quinol:cytochrome C oxidoreductase [Aureibaculum sp. 2210JD6-5]|uniref:quinol:cytochrome C oxidoreductase n=1 Tax=Aureibaculum sp. 2210JD6-5 TaxID=3103957 RepID=UPI002AAD2D76|nr:quinol:cytochrome C oxidoreductase [Aureibaculum sp. 2210JD6-5]MDY7394570.1 quinol:cytochrome C oxidoreductase [Aureibaculum sp. 2210JD6-5]